MPEIPTQPQPTSNQKSINWKRIIIISVVVAVICFLLASGGFYVQNSILKKTSQETTESTTSATPSAKPREKNLYPVITDATVKKGKWPFNLFSVSWYDPDNNPAMAIWCKSDKVLIEVGKPPSCPGGILIGPGGYFDGEEYTFTTAGRFNMSYHTTKSGVAYAFVCDNLGVCSKSVRRSYEPVPRTGYVPGSAPEVTNFEIDPQIASVGQKIYYRVTIEDTSDLVRMIVCKTNAVNYNNGNLSCPGGAWTSTTPPSFTVPTLIQAWREVKSEEVGEHLAFAFACDKDGVCSKGVQSSFEVKD